MSDDCLFCKIIAGDIPSEEVYSDDDVYAFRDINPAAPTHVQIIPKKHIPCIDDATEQDEALLGKLILRANEIAEKEVPVRLLFNDALSRNYRLRGNPEIEPKTKIIRGPSRRLANLNYLTTKPFLIDSSHTKDYISSVAVSLPEGVSVEYDKVKTVIHIEPAEKSMALARQSLAVMTQDSFESIELPYVDAVIYGPPGILEELDMKDLHFFVEKSQEDQLAVQFWCKHPEINVQSVMPTFIVNPWKKKNGTD